MARRYASTYRRSSAWDARADAKRAAAEAAGIPMRDDTDCRSPIALDLSRVGGDALVLEPCRGKVAWRARRIDTGEVVARAALKALLHCIADRLPRMLAERNLTC